MDKRPTPPADEFARFDALTRKLLKVPKKVLDRKVAAFKKRRRKPSH